MCSCRRHLSSLELQCAHLHAGALGVPLHHPHEVDLPAHGACSQTSERFLRHRRFCEPAAGPALLARTGRRAFASTPLSSPDLSSPSPPLVLSRPSPRPSPRPPPPTYKQYSPPRPPPSSLPSSPCSPRSALTSPLCTHLPAVVAPQVGGRLPCRAAALEDPPRHQIKLWSCRC